jgi:hypothetical protein
MRRFSRWLGVILIGAVVGSAAEYFPAGVLGDTSDEHQFRADWYSKHLTAMGEPSLWELSRQDSTVEVYRFLWLRTFHHPISVRLAVRKDGTALLVSKEMDGMGGYEPGKLIRNTTAPLSKEQTELFRGRVEDFAIWKLPTRQSDGIGLDGAQWIIEMAKSGRYHVIDRWSPRADDPVHRLGTVLLINLAHFKLLYKDVY